MLEFSDVPPPEDYDLMKYDRFARMPGYMRPPLPKEEVSTPLTQGREKHNMLANIKPWISEDQKYYYIGSQWLVNYSPNWGKNAIEQCEKIKFIIINHLEEERILICEIQPKTRIFDIRKLSKLTGIKNVSPNWLIKIKDLEVKRTIEEEKRIREEHQKFEFCGG